MTAVRRAEIVPLAVYERMRDDVRREVIQAKQARRLHLGEHLTLLFENHRTVWYQIQEMLRAERIADEAGIAHEIETYNEILGGPGQLGVTLLIELEDPETRVPRLRAWRALPGHLYAALPDGRRVRPWFDPRQVGEDRLSSVQYLKFDVGGQVPVAFGCDLPDLTLETRLTPEQQAALRGDLDAGR